MHNIETKITGVKIYRNGAETVRRGQAELKGGTNHLRIAGMTQGTDADTVRLYFPAGITMSDIRFLNTLNQEPEEKESDRIRAEITALKQQIEVKELQISLWKENGSFVSRQEQNLQDIETYITKLPERLSTLHQEMAALQKEIKGLEKKLNEAVEDEACPLISVEVEAPADGVYDFEIHSHESESFWQPVYEIHTDAEGPLTMRVRARIFQNTGKDWENVNVSLLTGTPAAGGSMPVINPVYLSIYTPQPVRARANSNMMMGTMKAMAAPMMAEEAMDTMAMDDTVQLSRLETAGAEISSEETMTEYILPGTKTIPSDSEGTMADLQQFDLKADYVITAIPKMDIRAWLKASLSTKDLPAMVRGEASVYLSGIYAGKAYINPDLTKDTFDIALGQEEAVQLRRNEKQKKTSKALLKNQRTTEYTYELTITNSKTKEITVTVQDRIPVSRDKTIIVEPVQTDKAELDEEKGILTWKVKLEPKEIRTLNLAYRVSWPKDKQIQETVSQNNRFCPVCGARVYNTRFCPECGSPVD
ncbi:MAG: mucoidy inhibitor MuiA family protein [Solobacterium sp.]|nr:mucoidy inhibitor MuiA family protein [Solobacterium sp.]